MFMAGYTTRCPFRLGLQSHMLFSFLLAATLNTKAPRANWASAIKFFRHPFRPDRLPTRNKRHVSMARAIRDRVFGLGIARVSINTPNQANSLLWSRQSRFRRLHRTMTGHAKRLFDDQAEILTGFWMPQSVDWPAPRGIMAASRLNPSSLRAKDRVVAAIDMTSNPSSTSQFPWREASLHIGIRGVFRVLTASSSTDPTAASRASRSVRIRISCR